MASFTDRKAAQDRAAARARIQAIYTNAADRAGTSLPLPANIEAQIDRAVATGGDYFNTIRNHAARNAQNPGQLADFNQTYQPPEPVFTSPGQPSPDTQPATDAPLYPDEGPDLDAKARLLDTLRTYGLESLSDWAWNMLVAGHSELTILQELRQRQEYKDRFPYMEELRGRGRAINEGQAIALERQFAQVSRQYGLPESFYDQPSDFAAYIGGEVAVTEFEDRLQLWRQVADQKAADPNNANTLDELSRLYGITPDSGEWLALVIDKNRALPTLERQAASARMSAEARNVGFGPLSVAEAERVSGVGVQAAREGFGVLAESSELFRRLPGREGSEQTVSRDDQFGAVFDQDADALRAIRRQRAGRVAEFAGGGGFASDREGLSGLGRAQT